jgi:flagellin-like hook-associated protein FlgL
MITLSQTQVAYQAALQSTTTIMSKSLMDYL